MGKNNKITIDLDDVIDMNIEIVYSNGLPAVQFRKIISMCDKNIIHVKDILKKALSEETELIMPVRIKIQNKPLAIGKIKQAGIILD